MSGRRSKRIGKDGERNAGNFLKGIGCYQAMTEISGLAGDDKFVRDPNGKWWSVEVKNTVDCKRTFIGQAKEQAEHRFHAIQKELCGPDAEVYYTLGLDKFTKNDWLLMWHPRQWGLAADEWHCTYKANGSNKTVIMTKQTGWAIG